MQVQYTQTFDDYVNQSQVIRREQISWGKRYVWIFPLIINGTMVPNWTAPTSREYLFLGFLIAVFGVGVIGTIIDYSSIGQRYRMRRTLLLRGYQQAQEAVTLTIDASGVSTRSAEVSGQLAWSRISAISDTPTMVMLRSGDSQALLIPARAFSSAEQRQQFLTEATRYWESAQQQLHAAEEADSA